MNVIIIAPHPDDETLGCGGTLLRHRENGDHVHWMIVTDMSADSGYNKDLMDARHKEIEAVHAAYGFASVTKLGYAPAGLDEVPLRQIVSDISRVVQEVQPKILYLPFCGDAHSDHRVTFNAALACTKWFRAPYLKSVLAYETLSETDILGHTPNSAFAPNVFIDITEYLDRKIEIMRTYASEMAPFPHPRSEEAIRSLAQVRGASSGSRAAESFMLIKERR